jgi:hypothetical protein
MPINSLFKDTDKFPRQNWAIYCEFKEIDGITRRRTRERRTSDFAV